MAETKRKYEMRRRAEQVAETRARIVAATAELHREVGPARTTVAEIARRAGVERLTVYKHFPDDRDLFDACQTHWLAQSPPPDPSPHAAVSDPDERTEAVLRDLYAWYRGSRPMLQNVLRDAETLPALAETLELQRRALGATLELLERGRSASGARRERLRAALALVLDFHSWATLADSGLDDGQAAALGAAMVAAL